MTRHYSDPEIDAMWEDEETFRIWALIEAAVLGAQFTEGLIPQEWVTAAWGTPPPSVLDVQREQILCRHEVVAFLRAWGVQHVHIGLTSSDLTDTALAIRIALGTNVVKTRAVEVSAALAGLSERYPEIESTARTHGQPAQVVPIRHTLAVLGTLVTGEALSIPEVPGKIGGPTGTSLNDQTRQYVAEILDVPIIKVSTQIVPRVYLSRWGHAVADLVAVYALAGRQIRQWAEHGEAYEGTGPAYAGSSAMPHKRNPNQSERLEGLSRMARSMANSLSEGILQWGYRDLAHSSVEREFVPSLLGLAAHSGSLLTEILQNLEFDIERIEENIRRHQSDLNSHHRQTEMQMQGVSYTDAAHAAGGAS